MIRINQIKLEINKEKKEDRLLKKIIGKKLRLSEDAFDYIISKKTKR